MCIRDRYIYVYIYIYLSLDRYRAPAELFTMFACLFSDARVQEIIQALPKGLAVKAHIRFASVAGELLLKAWGCTAPGCSPKGFFGQLSLSNATVYKGCH